MPWETQRRGRRGSERPSSLLQCVPGTCSQASGTRPCPRRRDKHPGLWSPGPSLGNECQICQYPWASCFPTHQLGARGCPSTCKVTECSHPKLCCAQVLLLQPLSPGQVLGEDIQAASIFWTERQMVFPGWLPSAGAGSGGQEVATYWVSPAHPHPDEHWLLSCGPCQPRCT